MNFRRPIVPSRVIELICLGCGVIAVTAMSVYVIWAAFRGLISWRDVPVITIAMAVGSLPLFAMGFIFRRGRLRKATELKEYERVLMTLADQT